MKNGHSQPPMLVAVDHRPNFFVRAIILKFFPRKYATITFSKNNVVTFFQILLGSRISTLIKNSLTPPLSISQKSSLSELSIAQKYLKYHENLVKNGIDKLM